MRGPFEIIKSLGLSPITGVLQVGANTGQEVPYFVANGVQLAATNLLYMDVHQIYQFHVTLIAATYARAHQSAPEYRAVRANRPLQGRSRQSRYRRRRCPS